MNVARTPCEGRATMCCNDRVYNEYAKGSRGLEAGSIGFTVLRATKPEKGSNRKHLAFSACRLQLAELRNQDLAQVLTCS
jgi:hypothetical protein